MVDEDRNSSALTKNLDDASGLMEDKTDNWPGGDNSLLQNCHDTLMKGENMTQMSYCGDTGDCRSFLDKMSPKSMEMEEIRNMKGGHESEASWQRRKKFLIVCQSRYPKETLNTLSYCYVNVLLYGCRYSESLMDDLYERACDVANYPWKDPINMSRWNEIFLEKQEDENLYEILKIKQPKKRQCSQSHQVSDKRSGITNDQFTGSPDLNNNSVAVDTNKAVKTPRYQPLVKEKNPNTQQMTKNQESTITSRKDTNSSNKELLNVSQNQIKPKKDNTAVLGTNSSNEASLRESQQQSKQVEPSKEDTALSRSSKVPNKSQGLLVATNEKPGPVEEKSEFVCPVVKVKSPKMGKVGKPGKSKSEHCIPSDWKVTSKTKPASSIKSEAKGTGKIVYDTLKSLIGSTLDKVKSVKQEKKEELKIQGNTFSMGLVNTAVRKPPAEKDYLTEQKMNLKRKGSEATKNSTASLRKVTDKKLVKTSGNVKKRTSKEGNENGKLKKNSPVDNKSSLEKVVKKTSQNLKSPSNIPKRGIQSIPTQVLYSYQKGKSNQGRDAQDNISDTNAKQKTAQSANISMGQKQLTVRKSLPTGSLKEKSEIPSLSNSADGKLLKHGNGKVFVNSNCKEFSKGLPTMSANNGDSNVFDGRQSWTDRQTNHDYRSSRELYGYQNNPFNTGFVANNRERYLQYLMMGQTGIYGRPPCPNVWNCGYQGNLSWKPEMRQKNNIPSQKMKKESKITKEAGVDMEKKSSTEANGIKKSPNTSHTPIKRRETKSEKPTKTPPKTDYKPQRRRSTRESTEDIEMLDSILEQIRQT